MFAIEIHQHMKKLGTWVNWKLTSDKFLWGNPKSKIPIRGIAVSWMPTLNNLKKAKELGCNLYITHEPLYAKKIDKRRLIFESDPFHKTFNWLRENDLIVYRCHDVWDDFPEIGIHGAWAKYLGFNSKPINSQKFYEIHQMEPTKVSDLALKLLEKLKNLHQESIQIVGNPDLIVSKIAFGTGAITNYRIMNNLGADVLLLTDDGTRLWESAQWVNGLFDKKCLLIVNHATAEEPGMITLANYLQKQFPNIPVYHIPVGCLYTTKMM